MFLNFRKVAMSAKLPKLAINTEAFGAMRANSGSVKNASANMAVADADMARSNKCSP